MGSNKIKVVGYAQKIFYNNGIEYRNYTPDLIGKQFGSSGGTTLFTTGNFIVTTNIDPKLDKSYKTNTFSKFIALSSLTTSQTQKNLLVDSSEVKLNLDTTILSNYAYFGPLSEFVRVSLEHIISNWPASIYVTPRINATTGYTVENYSYSPINDVTKFKTNINFLDNKYGVNITMNHDSTITPNSDSRDLAANYSGYTISNINGDFNIVSYNPPTNTDNCLYFSVRGNPFTGDTINKSEYFHIKPNSVKINSFFSSLPDFEKTLLNRLVTPIYTSKFSYIVKSDNGISLSAIKQLTWPTSDGYNIDFNTVQYIVFVNELLTLANASDSIQTNIMARFLVSDSITSFDTISKNTNDETDQKMSKVLTIYGRGFDEIKKFSDGISLANIVTYNKQDNTPDSMVKILAKTLGWELTSSVSDNELVSTYITPNESTFSGQSIGLTPHEADIEMWRRLVINTAWLWKSKGTRKAIEFLFKFIGAPSGLINFNEYIYLADSPINMVEFLDLLEFNTGSKDISNILIDANGYPSTIPNNTNMYFQKGGLWYRQTGGINSDIDILNGNNPHVGPYDGGNAYISQYTSLIPNFSATTLVEETRITGTTNLFTNFNNGTMNNKNDTSIKAICTTIIDWLDKLTLETNNCYDIHVDGIVPMSSCTFTTKWYSLIYIDSILVYTSPVFYSSINTTDTPTQIDYINALQSGATALSLDLNTSSGVDAIFTEIIDCSAIYNNKSFETKIKLDIKIT
jgi:hypothetical protein